jgi:hypothetical protein
VNLDQLYGTWQLISIYAENPQGESKFPFGEDACGRLTYNRDGYMSAFLTRKTRNRFSGRGIDGGSAAEIKQAFESFDAYSGRFAVDLDAGVITHHIDIARSPSWVGTKQLRYFKFIDGILSIYTPPLHYDDQDWVVHVSWQKRDENL